MNDPAATSQPGRFEAFVASTRRIKLVGESHSTSFALEALDDMARQVEDRCVWANTEHLNFLPPFGRWRRGEIRPTSDGESELYLIGGLLPQLKGNEPKELERALNRLPTSPEVSVSAHLTYDRRNFDPAVATDLESESGGIAQPTERWSDLPPLEYSLVIPVVWGATKFAGAFLEQLGKAAGVGLAAKISSWSKRSRQPDRVAVFVLDFELGPDAHLCGYVLAPVGRLEAAVDNAMQRVEELASIAGLAKDEGLLPGMKQSAFFFDQESWKLGWWTDGESVFRSTWFEENPPNSNGVLGR